jgi:hypothetical protein
MIQSNRKNLFWFYLFYSTACFNKEMETEETAEGDLLPKASTKKKPPKVEESRSKKEHVNVVFIGHVGELTNYFI